MITIERYDQLMDYLALKTRELNAHELRDLKENSKNKRDPELHDIWQSRFPITMCQEFVASGFIACWNNKFIDTLSLYERCIKSNPDAFHTGDAWDIIKCLYENSGYCRSIEDYDKYLRTEGCCYVVLNFGDMFDEILRIDLYRLIEQNPHSKQYEFTGGLFHCFKHFSLDGIGLNNNKNEKNDTFDLFHIVYLLGNAFKDAITIESDEGIIFIDETHKYHAAFYKEEKSTGIYFVRSMRKESK